MSDFQISKGIPVPAISRVGVAGQSKYPFAGMAAGDSFSVPVAEAPETVKDAAERDRIFKENARARSNRMTGACRRYREAHPDYAFAVRTMPDEKAIRVWRVAKEGDKAAKAAATPAKGK